MGLQLAEVCPVMHNNSDNISLMKKIQCLLRWLAIENCSSITQEAISADGYPTFTADGDCYKKSSLFEYRPGGSNDGLVSYDP